MSRHDRRIAEAKQRRLKREISAPGYSPIRDPPQRHRHHRPRGRVHRPRRRAMPVARFDNRTGAGELQCRRFPPHRTLVCRVGPVPRSDVVAFCGPANAGFGQLFHAWAEVDDYLLDFSVGDWRRLDGTGDHLGRGDRADPLDDDNAGIPVQAAQRPG